MACARNLGLTNLPIVCVSVDGYYDSFRNMLDRAFKECLIKNRPEDVVHFVSTAEEAVRWIEMQKHDGGEALPTVKKRTSVLRKASFLSTPAVFTKSLSFFSSEGDGEPWSPALIGTIAFVIGVSVGIISAPHVTSRK